MPNQFQIRLMSDRDGSDAVTLTSLMDWRLEEEDFRFTNRIEPGGCFVATSEGEVIGIITSVSFGSVGWFGNVIVAEEHRGKGIGKALVSRVMDHLRAKGVTTVGLYAYKDLVSFYEQFGFVEDKDFLWLVCKNAAWKGNPRPPLQRSDLQAVEELDRSCFGASRKRLIEAVFEDSPYLCRGAFRDGRLVTFLMGSRATSAEMGPWVCMPGYEDEGFALFQSLANEVKGLDIYIGVPACRGDIVNFLSGLGFVKEFTVVRMYWGPPVSDRGCVLAMESLERG